MTDGIADDRWFLWVPDWLEDGAEKDYLVLLNHGDRINKEFESFAKEIMNLQTADTFTMLFATDVHYIRKYANIMIWRQFYQ